MGWPDPFMNIPEDVPFSPKKPKNIISKIKRQPFKYLLTIIIILFLLLFLFLLFQRFVLGWYEWADWTGFSPYKGELAAENRGKTLWDWMGLFFIPLIIAISVVIINKRINEIDKENQLDQQREEVLEKYINKIIDLFPDFLKEDEPHEVMIIGRIYTLMTLRRLDGIRKGFLIQFLSEAGLINKLKGGQTKIDLRWSNLVDCQMDNAFLFSANLNRCFLNNSSMVNAFLRDSNLTYADLSHADLRGAYLKCADLSHARFRNANLRRADLFGTIIHDTDFSDAIMPDGKKYHPDYHTSEKLSV